MKTLVDKWADDSKSVYTALKILILAGIAAICLGFVSSLGRDFLTETDLEAIICSQLILSIPYIALGFVAALIHPIGTLPLFLIAGRYVLVCFSVVSMWSGYEAFHELTSFAVFLFALSPPGLLISFAAIKLLFWHWRFAAQYQTNKQQLTTNN